MLYSVSQGVICSKGNETRGVRLVRKACSCHCRSVNVHRSLIHWAGGNLLAARESCTGDTNALYKSFAKLVAACSAMIPLLCWVGGSTCTVISRRRAMLCRTWCPESGGCCEKTRSSPAGRERMTPVCHAWSEEIDAARHCWRPARRLDTPQNEPCPHMCARRIGDGGQHYNIAVPLKGRPHGGTCRGVSQGCSAGGWGGRVRS